ncbi:OmpA family protein [Granulicella sp. 5B5]|uniref:OmpA/MotB family protein n=1 Tax=Granulicella sp. 5B5 TaxID=1617967 RepID=UPI002105DBA3|nr:OmpA family protein [Granulicella sp. 5B5]
MREHDEDSRHERWTVSYADFMTLLFALFVVLFASSEHDRHSIQSVSSAVKQGFEHPGDDTSEPGVPMQLQPFTPSGLLHVSAGVNVVQLQRDLTGALGDAIRRQEVVLRMTPDGFVISLRELGFFNSGQAVLLPGAAQKVISIGEVLKKYRLNMRIEGHTDNVPIHNSDFNSNWDLSTARANSVAMMLIDEAHFDPAKLSIAGYGEYHPVSSNDNPAGRQANRRVDIVILSTEISGKR